MERGDLYSVLFEQQKDFDKVNPLILRTSTKKALELLKLKLPLVITGVRRCGKSFLLKLIKNELKLNEKSYFYVNFNDERLINFTVEDFQKILDFLIEQNYEENCFLFIDEIQEVSNWDKWVDRLKSKHQMIITGSNSKLLSSEISTILTGRSLSLALTPLNFTEFLQTKKITLDNWKVDLKKQANVRSSFKEYLEVGGFPKRILSGEKIILNELYEQILYRDVVKRFSKSQSKAIKEISIYLLSNPASPVTVRGISTLSNIKNLGTVKSIMNAFEGAFVFFFINKFDYSIRKQIQNPRKSYCVDNGFLTTLGFRLSEDKGKLLENLVAIELKRREKEIFYYSDKNECDFMIREKNKITEAIQVCHELNEKNKDRELNGLLEALNTFKLKQGIILTHDQQEELTVNNKKIKIIPVWKWLLN